MKAFTVTKSTFALFGVAICLLAILVYTRHQEALDTRPFVKMHYAGPAGTAMAAANNHFGWKLLQEMSSNSSDTDNIWISPTSIADALDLAYVGATGDTRTQLRKTLDFPKLSDKDFNSANQSLSASLISTDPKVQVSIANAIWADQHTPFLSSYVDTCGKYYDASAQTLDFSNPTSANTINSWVSEKTSGNIPTLVSPIQLQGADCVLTNAVYFKGEWSSQFKPEETAPAPFTLGTGEQIQLAAMHNTYHYPVTSNNQFQAISLPYGDGSVSMVIILPRAGVSTNDLLKTMNQESLEATLASQEVSMVDLQLPKFHVEYSAQLREPLQSLGIRDAFTQSAEFSGMGSPRYISAVIHKTMMDVDEQGTVAAAATGIGMARLIEMAPEKFIVDHPFICAIRDNDTGALLFLGVINFPAELR